MLDELQHLIDLQGLDDELAAAQGELARLPARRSELAATLERAEQRVLEAKQALEQAEADQRRAETGLQDREALLQKLENQQFQVKSNAAYTALLHEMEQAREAISGCETGILEAMDAIERASSEHATAQADAHALQSRCNEEGKALDARQEQLEGRVTELREQRAQVGAKVEPALLAQYERIAARHRPAVARVHHEICQGCRVNIPPQLHIELLRGQRLISCTYCQRILIPEETAPVGPK